MQEIKCPKCGEVFQIDEAGYAEIIKQVRNKEFEEELKQRESAFAAEKENAVKIELLKAQTQKEKELNDLQQKLTAQEGELKSLKEKNADEIKLALSAKEQEITRLQTELEANKNKIEMEVKNAVSAKEQEITKLQGELQTKKVQSEMEIKNAVQEKEAQIKELEGKLSLAASKKELELTNLKDSYETQLKMKDEQVAFYKDFKAKQSTKQIGEDLEQYCMSEFNKNRAVGFQNAYFEKDNDASEGSKGDFIFRESEDGVEFISIMFEMKNQMSTTATKHKNEDFFDKLDKDRKKKNCEYAVLVSMLEEDNDYYNTGIVDVSYKYPKMYVIRPQFFIPVITFLRNSAMNTLEYKKELAIVKNQNIDVTKFEDDFNDFKTKFYKDVTLAVNNHSSAIAQIDKAIKNLLDIKELFEKSDNHLRLANNKLEDMTIQKLTKNNPTMKQKFEEAKQNERK